MQEIKQKLSYNIDDPERQVQEKIISKESDAIVVGLNMKRILLN